MTKILFICHGNICRSPMAEFVFKDIAKKAGMGDEFSVASAATSYEEIGIERGDKNPQFSYVLRCLGCGQEVCRQKKPSDWYVMVMNEIDELLNSAGPASQWRTRHCGRTATQCSCPARQRRSLR